MAKIPSAQDVERRQSRPTRNAPRTSAAGAGLSGQGGAASAIAAGAQNPAVDAAAQVAVQLAEAEQRIDSRDDAYTRAKDFSGIQEAIRNEYLRVSTEGDLADREQAAGLMNFINTTVQNGVVGHAGSEESRVMLAERMEPVRSEWLGKVASDRVSAVNSFIMNGMETSLGELAGTAYGTPSLMGQYIQDWDALIDDQSAALTPEQEMGLRNKGRQDILLNSASRYLDDGDWRTAKRLLNDHPDGNSLTSAQQRSLGQRIATTEQQERAQRSGVQEGVAKAQEDLAHMAFILQKPIEDLTPEERMQAAGLTVGVSDTQKANESIALINATRTASGQPPLTPQETENIFRAASGLNQLPQTPERERQAEVLARDNNIPIAFARKIVLGVIQYDTVPETGDTRMIDMSTGHTAIMPGPTGLRITPDREAMLRDQNDVYRQILGLAPGIEGEAALAAGPWERLRSAFNILAGFAGEGAEVPAPVTAEARQAVVQFNQFVRAAMASGVNSGRISNQQMEWVNTMLPKEGVFLANPTVEFRRALQFQDWVESLLHMNMLSLGEGHLNVPSGEDQAQALGLTPESRLEHNIGDTATAEDGTQLILDYDPATNTYVWKPYTAPTPPGSEGDASP